MRFLVPLAAVVLTFGACSAAEDVADDAVEAVESATDDALASRVASEIEQRTALDAAQSRCVADALIADLGTGRVTRLVIESGGDPEARSDADRARLEAAAERAGDACNVDASDVV